MRTLELLEALSKTTRWGWFAAVSLLAAPLAADEPADAVQFNRDIRPILSDKCFKCHGPDEAQRQSELRLDSEASALADLGGYRAITPGEVKSSELHQRITSDDVDERMPPPETDVALSPREIELLTRWIAQGAQWQPHWSFIPPARPAFSENPDRQFIQNGIDEFIVARLRRAGLSPSPQADKATLLRRVTLDLTGLPPTPQEVDAFLADDSPDAYERAVDRLLASPRFGERLATVWLDLARYADTSGYQTDGDRHMWRWRDWVIAALNRNQPFDEFTVEQLAGDLLPDPSLDQLIATGFNRNHRANSEGGIVFEEYLVEYVVDRVDTTATVWLGLTMGCARCHDHKYDPLTQEDFYRVFAFFNNVPERGRVIKYGNSAPLIPAPTPPMQDKLAALDRQLAAAQAVVDDLQDEFAAAQTDWEAQASHDKADWSIEKGLAAHFRFDDDIKNDVGEVKTETIGDALQFVAGRAGQAAQFDGKQHVSGGETITLLGTDKFTFAAWIRPDDTAEGTIVSLMDDDDSRDKGFSLHIKEGKLQFFMGPRWLDDAVRVETTERLAPGEWRHVAFTYDGSQFASGIKIYVDGQQRQTKTLLDILTGGFTSKPALRIGSRGEAGHFQGAIDDLRFYGRAMAADEIAAASCDESIGDIAAIPAEKRSLQQAAKLRACFLDQFAPEPIRDAHQHLADIQNRREEFVASLPTTMIMRDRKEPRETFVLVRGEYDKPGEKVEADVPSAIAPLPPGAPQNRLGFAQWLVDPANPLTARVMVNRLWQVCFGVGLVATSEDFGAQGEWPSHPELLDWLAVEFAESGWDVKQMVRLIVTSAAYRQSSTVTPHSLEHDADNRLLSRMPRLRLPAEMIRDQALTAGGLIDNTIGGPSVRPYQPDGLWTEIASQTYTPDSGAALYRRSMYTFWKRTVPPPTMSTFDAPSREACTVSRARTNTPLQALALMNDVTYVEAARALAERALRESGIEPSQRIERIFRLVLGRRPAAAELDILTAGYARSLERFQADPSAAASLIAIGESQPSPNFNAIELAAYTTVASLVLNLDEAITRE